MSKSRRVEDRSADPTGATRSIRPTGEILRLAQPPVRRFLPGLLAGLTSALMAVLLLACSAWLITRASEMPPILFLGMAVVGVRAFALGRSAFRYLERLLSHDAAFGQLAELRVGVFERIVPLAPAALSDTRRGDLLSRLVRDVDDLQDLPLRVVQPLIIAGLTALLSVAGVWYLLPSAGLTLLISLILAGVLGTLSTGLLSARSERLLAPLRGDLADEVLEVVENLDVLTAFGALDERLGSLARTDERLRRAALRRSLGVGVQSGVTSLFAGAATLAALVWGAPQLGTPGTLVNGFLVGGMGLSGPALTVAILVPLAVFEVFGMVPLAVSAWRQVRASAERVATAVPSVVPAEIPREPVPGAAGPVEVEVESFGARSSEAGSLGLSPAAGTPVLELSGAGASWPGSARPAFADVSLRLAPGDRVHLAGPSGAGKTTLAQTLVRFLDYTGSYRLGGVEARALPPAAVRRVVGLCEQRPWLFDESIRQNLLFARDTATDADLLAVLDRVGLADWTTARGGLDARVGERGALVSGGQAQRIALARALLADFPILIVDEPTANVDADRGDQLVRDILSLAATDGRAVLLISHTPVPEDLITSRVTLFPFAAIHA